MEKMIDFNGWILYGSIIIICMILFVLKIKFKKDIVYLFFSLLCISIYVTYLNILNFQSMHLKLSGV